MTTAIQNIKPQIKPGALAVMANRLSVDPAKLCDTLKATVFKGASNEELLALTVVANEYDLNPFLKEIYAFPAKGGGIVPIVSVDGWNKMLIRHPSFDGIEFEMTDDQEGNPHSCTATIHVKGRSHAVKITEYFSECFRSTDPWKNMPRRMLRNRTLCQASRVAFGFSGVNNEDEAASITVESYVMPSEPPPKLVAVTSEQTAPVKQRTLIQEIEAVLEGPRYDFNNFRKWCIDSKQAAYMDSCSEFAELKEADAKRIVRMLPKMLSEIATAKGNP